MASRQLAVLCVALVALAGRASAHEWMKEKCEALAAQYPAGAPWTDKCYDCYHMTMDAGCFEVMQYDSTHKDASFIIGAALDAIMAGKKGPEVRTFCELPAHGKKQFMACITCLGSTADANTWACKACLDSAGKSDAKADMCMKGCVAKQANGQVWACPACLDKFSALTDIATCNKCVVTKTQDLIYKCLQ